MLRDAAPEDSQVLVGDLDEIQLRVKHQDDALRYSMCAVYSMPLSVVLRHVDEVREILPPRNADRALARVFAQMRSVACDVAHCVSSSLDDEVTILGFERVYAREEAPRIGQSHLLLVCLKRPMTVLKIHEPFGAADVLMPDVQYTTYGYILRGGAASYDPWRSEDDMNRSEVVTLLDGYVQRELPRVGVRTGRYAEVVLVWDEGSGVAEFPLHEIVQLRLSGVLRQMHKCGNLVRDFEARGRTTGEFQSIDEAAAKLHEARDRFGDPSVLTFRFVRKSSNMVNAFKVYDETAQLLVFLSPPYIATHCTNVTLEGVRVYGLLSGDDGVEWSYVVFGASEASAG
jgi:hypothetical protein